MTAVTVVVSMRVVGLLLISALMIVPVATARLRGPSFRATVAIAVALGVAVSVAGVSTSFYTDTPSGGTIVLFAVGVFMLTAAERSRCAPECVERNGNLELVLDEMHEAVRVRLQADDQLYTSSRRTIVEVLGESGTAAHDSRTARTSPAAAELRVPQPRGARTGQGRAPPARRR